MRILNLVETAYRGTLEEQDDTVLGLAGALKSAGADLTVVLRGNAVNYAVRQACPPLVIGSAIIKHPARPNDDLTQLLAKGAKVYVIREDLAERGIGEDRCVAEAQPLARADVVDLMESHDQVWHW
jgi:sulfur relay protein TusB/DsrH